MANPDNFKVNGDSAMRNDPIHETLMPAVYVCHMMREFDQPAAILDGSNLALDELERPGHYITVEQNLRCVANAMKLASSPAWYLPWGLRIAEYIHGPLTPAMLTAPTLGDGLDAFLRYFGQRIPYMEIRALRGATHLEIELTPRLDVGELLPPLIEIPFLILQHYVCTVRRLPMDGARVEFGYAARGAQREYRKWFECEMRFEAPRNVLRLPKAWRATPNLGYDESLWQAALAKCAELAPPQGASAALYALRGQLQRLLNNQEQAAAPPTLDEVARRMNTSPRTLIRRLRAAGTTYQLELDNLRRLRATEMLRHQDQPISAIADCLGFADAAGFAKAFKRWTGVSPSTWRKSVSAS
ncbi:MAG: AraC family transcriptional regulator ligand-binding domain-containing protein [Proteobacteria bacterium]|nr:AraC family transcriptional regulator ligand-binding domain-containing protein [Pseudomonadota bacterium]